MRYQVLKGRRLLEKVNPEENMISIAVQKAFLGTTAMLAVSSLEVA